RAHEFGLVPVEDTGAMPPGVPVVEPPDRLLAEEEPEAFEDQHLDDRRDGDEQDEVDAADADQPDSRLGPEDLDLVRGYLADIGRRKLLKAHEEQEIGRRTEQARADLLAELAAIPAARATLIALAEQARTNAAPAAELILLPDGGELKPEHIEPVLRAFARI